jgi:DNA-binding GntR family transcriptional regulator
MPQGKRPQSPHAGDADMPFERDSAAKPARPGGKLQRQTMTEQVLEVLRQKILAGDLAPGEAIRQEALAEELGVSRIPVREAIQRLEVEGIVDIYTHRGAFVRALSVSEVTEAFEIRARLEPWLCRTAASVIDEETLARARTLAEGMDQADSNDWGRLNWSLHETLYLPAKRDMTLAMLKQLHDRTDRYFRFQVVNAPIRAQAHEEHLELIDLCARRDLDGVERSLLQHIDTAAKQIVTIVENLMRR